MSLGARATKGGVKKDGKQDKGKVAEKPAPKEKTKPQATTEQLRMANMIDCKSEDASDVRRMVTQLMEMTRRTEEEVCSALHDSDNDMQAACNLLLEESQRIQGEWQTSEKKKKKPPAPGGNGDADRDARDRDARSRSGPRRRGEGEAVPPAGGGRGRGAGRGRGGSRGGRGAGRGARRGGAPRGHGHPRDADWPHAPDTAGGNVDSFPTTEDWDNEEWSGSLSDTKVFTPSSSALPTEPPPPAEDWESGETNGGEHIPTYTYHNTHQHIPQMSNTNAASSVSATAATGEEYGGGHHQPMGMSGSLSAAQTQYLSQFTTQTRHDGVYGYGVYGGEATRKQRARVPPPSKIPSSAVEMPGGSDGTNNVFLDVQFGALEPDALHDLPQPSHTSHSGQTHASHAVPPSQSQAPLSQSPTIPVQTNKQVTSQPENQSVPSHETTTEAPSNNYSNANSMLNESLSAVDTTPTSQPVTSESVVTNSTSLDKLSASMKQLGVSGGVAGGPAGVPAGADPPRHHYAHHRPKVTSPTAYQSVGQQNVYAPHHVSHHPPVYGANVYAPQVNSTNASLTGASMASGYPSSVTLTQYQPIINSYQQQQQTPSTTVSAVSVSAYGGSALYTAAPYTAPPAHHPYHHQPKHHKDSPQAPQYDSSVASSNSLTSTSTTQTSTAKVATTTVSGAAGAVSSSSSAAGAGAAYAGGALYGGAYAYDEQLMRGTLPHHMAGYYEVGYNAREGTFGLGAGERFGRTDAASPQQVPAALPPGYAYFYQPPPTSFQYGVYPPYGGGSSVGGVGGVGVSGGGKVSAYTQQQQPPYEAQDTYKPGGPYTGSASKGSGGANDLTNTMYAKTHVALNKVNSYEKAGFHSGTPPPFGAGSHLYIPAPPHHHPHHHAPQQHQFDFVCRWMVGSTVVIGGRAVLVPERLPSRQPASPRTRSRTGRPTRLSSDEHLYIDEPSTRRPSVCTSPHYITHKH